MKKFSVFCVRARSGDAFEVKITFMNIKLFAYTVRLLNYFWTFSIIGFYEAWHTRLMNLNYLPHNTQFHG